MAAAVLGVRRAGASLLRIKVPYRGQAAQVPLARAELHQPRLLSPFDRLLAPQSLARGVHWRCFSTSDGHVVKTPSFGAESITEGSIAEWRVKVGDSVTKGAVIVSIETDKVTVDVNADVDGVVQAIHLLEGDTAEVGSALCTLGSPGSAPAAEAPAAAPAASTPAAAKPPAGPAAGGAIHQVKTPEFGAESITEGQVMGYEFRIGDYVEKGALLTTIETDKVGIDVKAEVSGTLKEILIQPDDTAEVGAVLCTIEEGPPPEGTAAAPAAPAAAPSAAPPSPAKPAPTATKAAAKPTQPSDSTPGVAKASHREERRVKMTRMRKTIASSLKHAQNTTAMLTTFQEVDMSGIIQLRKEYKDLFESVHGAKLGFMSPFVKASAFALEQIPTVNAVIDPDSDDIIYRDYIDISVAVASPKGLVVPVIRNVESMSLNDIESKIAEFGQMAKNESFTMDDFAGGTFTISNGGVFGSMLGTPIINFKPQTAILGMHATKMRPVVTKSGAIEPRPIMYVALTYDHRLVDGREAVTFLCTVRDQLEDPRRMMLAL